MSYERVGPTIYPELEHELCRIRDFALRKNMLARQVVAIFETGVAATARLHPEWLNQDENSSDAEVRKMMQEVAQRTESNRQAFFTANKDAA